MDEVPLELSDAGEHPEDEPAHRVAPDVDALRGREEAELEGAESDRANARLAARGLAEATVARRILDHLGLDSQGPPVAMAQAPPELFDPGPDYDVADPAHGD